MSPSQERQSRPGKKEAPGGFFGSGRKTGNYPMQRLFVGNPGNFQ
jgi:hypothetical protein